MIPVIFVHQGMSDYLIHSLNKASQKNKVVLLGDQPKDETIFQENNIDVFHLGSDVDDTEVVKFQEVYHHMHTGGFGFEFFCYARWFFIKEYMEKNNINVVLYIDSDVLLYVDDIEREYKKFEQFDFTISHKTSGHTSVWTLKGITDFCNFMMDTYSDRDGFNFHKLYSHHLAMQSCNLGGGVCDMTLLELYGRLNAGKIGEMMYINNDSVYDHNLREQDQYFEFENGRKKIQYIDGIPYVKSLKLDKLIRFNAIHFQGDNKRLMGKAFDMKDGYLDE